MKKNNRSQIRAIQRRVLKDVKHQKTKKGTSISDDGLMMYMHHEVDDLLKSDAMIYMHDERHKNIAIPKLRVSKHSRNKK